MTEIYLDYTGRLTADQIRQAGASGVCRYLSWLSNPKVCLKPEYDSLTLDGIDVILNWEFDTYDWMGGAPVGDIHGKEAVRQAKELGYPLGKPIPGSCDFNISRTTWDASGKAYGLAYSAQIASAGYLPGVYGPWNALQWCKEEIPAFGWFWQAGMSWAWDNNNQDWPNANLIQRRHRTINGLDTDVNDVINDWRNTVTLPNWTQAEWDQLRTWVKNAEFMTTRSARGIDPIRDITYTDGTEVVAGGISNPYMAIEKMISGITVTMTPDLAAKMVNDISEAVYERIKEQFNKS